MEEARYWMWKKDKGGWKSHFDASISNSWEEEAFAKDASQPYGAFIWPPRSYSCSFCRREFKTAQALGGHMNVHRRDRARLKLPPPSPSDTEDPEDQISTLVCINPNPNSADHRVVAVAAQLSPSQVSAHPSIQENLEESHEGNFSYLFPQAWSNHSVPIRVFSNISASKRMEEITPTKKRKSRVLDDEGNSSKSDLSMSLNLVNIGPDKEQAVGSCKIKRRRSTDQTPVLPCFLKGSSATWHDFHSQISTAEELDLELRLGDPPKVK